jgi:opacity protein-like surface antigen
MYRVRNCAAPNDWSVSMKTYFRWGFRTLAMAITAAATVAPAIVKADESGVYVAAIGGFNMMSNQAFQFTPPVGASTTNQAQLGSSWLAGGTLGYRLNNSSRIEAEYIYRRNKVSGVAVPQFAGATATGDYNSVQIMANGLFDFAEWSIGTAKARPYIGVGLGLAQEVDTDLSAPGRTGLEFSGNKFTYQLLTGVRIEYDSGLFSGIGLSYGKTSKVKMKGSSSTTGIVTSDYEPLSIRISAGYRF